MNWIRRVRPTKISILICVLGLYAKALREKTWSRQKMARKKLKSQEKKNILRGEGYKKVVNLSNIILIIDAINLTHTRIHWGNSRWGISQLHQNKNKFESLIYYTAIIFSLDNQKSLYFEFCCKYCSFIDCLTLFKE